MTSEEIKIVHCLGRIEGTLASVDAHLKVQDKRLDAHSGKIERLQKTSAWRAGASAVAGVVLGFFGKDLL